MVTATHGMEQRKRVYLTPEAILRYLITDNEALDTLIMCTSAEVDIYTTDRDVYEALGSIRPYDTFKLNKLTKLFEVVEVLKARKGILTDKRVDDVRKLALMKEDKQGTNIR